MWRGSGELRRSMARDGTGEGRRRRSPEVDGEVWEREPNRRSMVRSEKRIGDGGDDGRRGTAVPCGFTSRE
ncbi:uncharacterized protein A4U43_C10F15920 [Asparagus officinalis]|uniref:Uncharacterized protein n=1 Tax=Asparagus officinalis TaxID=4686 RepID=A0A5P1E6C9_ASPOF|nr:uncharacterized protein A4U43_C10F15920 [Asparagus officinalis]